MKQREIYKLAIAKWGKDLQITMLIEEMAELTQSLTKILRCQPESYDLLTEEIADVEIMLGQMRVVFLDLEKRVQRWKRIKKYRLLKLIKQNQNELNFENKK